MADLNHSTLRVGILIATGLTMFAFAVLSLRHGAQLFSNAEQFEVHFHRINGLQTGAPVMLRGVRVGAVRAIGFPDDPAADYVIVRLSIQKGAARRLRADSLVKIASLGLLGDKFVILTGGTAGSPPASPSAVLAGVDPIDYATLLQRKDTNDTVANIMAITESIRTLTEAINNGHGLVHELLYGPAANSNQRTLTLESLRATVDAARRTTVDLDALVRQAESGHGIVGALLNGDGRRFDANLQETAASARAATATLDELAIRYRNADGAIPQLMENREYAREVMGNLQQSSADLEQILHKINTGQGTIGKLVNNPELYDSAQKLVATQGWGVAFMKAVYGIFHPLSSTEPGPAACMEPQQAVAQPMLIGPGTPAEEPTGSLAVPLQVNSPEPAR
jgi:phospholipid/cholesterol/gamma-HCH transport system substrate-binding protein